MGPVRRSTRAKGGSSLSAPVTIKKRTRDVLSPLKVDTEPAREEYSGRAETFKMPRSTRMTATHVFFWGGPLGNWNVGAQYTGKPCLEYFMPRLDELKVEHPPADAFSTRLISSFTFNCGEQFMMAAKGWLFERDLEVGEKVGLKEHEFQALRKEMLGPVPPAGVDAAGRLNMYQGTLCKVLRAKRPKEQKQLGRQTRNFEVRVWDVASIPITVGFTIARALADDGLQKVYLESGSRKFVEGSPRDNIWGVGIRWDRKKIEDPSQWEGQNRLGVCHDQACAEVQKILAESQDEREA